jgi:Domain of unknown function (DUF4386)
MSRPRTTALVAGLLYFSTHVTSVAAVAAYSVGGREAILLGVALEVLLALGVLGTGAVLLPLLAPYGAVLANAFSAMRTLEAAIIAMGTLPMLALIAVQESPDAASPAIGETLLALHAGAFLVGQGLIISVNTLVIGSLLARSGVVPRWIGILGIAGGALVLVGNVLQLTGALAPGSAWAGLFAAPVFVFEISFAAVLVFRGLRSRTPAPAAAFAA